jgi:hypothetical protein
LRRVWSYLAPSPIRRLSLAREPGALLAVDQDDRLTWLSSSGAAAAHFQAPAPLADAVIADDGSAVVAVGATGQIWYLTPALKPRWQQSIPGKALACAVEPLGRLLAVSDSAGGVHFFDGVGGQVGHARNPRPVLHFAFVPERELLLGCAEFGSVVALSRTGVVRWHDTPVAHCGSLSTTGNGRLIAQACFSDGVACYGLRGDRLNAAPRPGPCRLAALAYDGSSMLTVGLDGIVRLHGANGATRSEWKPEASVTAIAFGALGTTAYAGQADGNVIALEPG